MIIVHEGIQLLLLIHVYLYLYVYINFPFLYLTNQFSRLNSFEALRTKIENISYSSS